MSSEVGRTQEERRQETLDQNTKKCKPKKKKEREKEKKEKTWRAKYTPAASCIFFSKRAFMLFAELIVLTVV